MRIAVFGAGGVGGYFGGRLAEAGEAVTFIARGDHLRAMLRDGLRVASISGDFVVTPVAAAADPATVGPVDVVLVAVKAWQLPAAAAAMEPLLTPETLIIPLQNGVEAPEQLAAALGRSDVAGGLCRIIAEIAGPGRIEHTGAAPHIAFGLLDGRSDPRLAALQAAFARARGVTAEIPADIAAAMWRKFLMIATFSGVGAVTRAPIGVIRAQPETRALLEQSLQEIDAVARARGVRLDPAAPAAALAFMDGLPPAATASLQRDIRDGRPSELASQSGAVVRLGQEVAVPTPLHRFIYASLMPQELRARGELPT